MTLSTGAKVVLGLFAFCLLTIGVQTWRLVAAERRVAALELAPASAATVAAAARVETVTVRLAAAERTVTRTIQSVRVDTFVVAPRTAQDTATALVQLPTLVAAHDSLQRACTAFVVSCTEFRAAAEGRFRADSTYRAGLERALAQAQPSGLAAAWNKIKLPLAFAGGLYVGATVLRR